MSKINKLFALILTIGLFSVAGVSAATGKQDSKDLEKKVFKQIISMPYYGVFDSIGFEVKGDTVVLSGKVYNALNRKTAERRVEKLDGVSEVVNNIEVLPPSSFDDRIRRNTVRSFARTGGLYRYLVGVNPSIRIIVDRGHITLEGYVSKRGDSRLAGIIAQTVPSVFSVTNNLVVSDGKKF